MENPNIRFDEWSSRSQCRFSYSDRYRYRYTTHGYMASIIGDLPILLNIPTPHVWTCSECGCAASGEFGTGHHRAKFYCDHCWATWEHERINWDPPTAVTAQNELSVSGTAPIHTLQSQCSECLSVADGRCGEARHFGIFYCNQCWSAWYSRHWMGD